MKKVTIIILTKNQKDLIGKCINACLNQNYNKKDYEILVVDDFSTDGARDVLKTFASERVRLKLLEEWNGRVKAENIGIEMTKTPYLVLLNANCIPERNWLKTLMKNFKSERTASVSSFSKTGGTSTAFVRRIFNVVGMFDEEYGELGTGFRDDTDMAFRILDKGFENIFAPEARFAYLRGGFQSLTDKIKYSLGRVMIHKFDPLLYKKHPKRAKEFFDIKFGFLRNPLRDFKTATGLWASRGNLSLSSPQGARLIESKSFLHTILIIILGFAYTFLVKLARLYGSFKYKKLLI